LSTPQHEQLLALLTRRQALRRASTLGLGALVMAALPVAERARAAGLTLPSDPSLSDATLQAFADTMIPGRKVTRTALGNPVDPLAIAGVDPLPGAVEADALALYHHPEVGFDDLTPAFLSHVETESLPHGGDFLHLGWDARVAVCLSGLAFDNQLRLIWEAAAAVPFTAFCAAALIRNATAATAPGYRVMGLPGVAPGGYRSFSYRRRLSKERTRTGSLP
jgi:hypothetical protein